eukprot:UN32634
MIDDFKNTFESREQYRIQDGFVSLIWFYYSQTSQCWVRACLGINTKLKKGIICYRNDLFKSKDTDLKYFVLHDANDSQLLYTLLNHARDSMEDYITTIVNDSMICRDKLGYAQTRSCCKILQWSKWSLPQDIHQFIDNVLYLHTEVDSFLHHVVGFQYLVGNIISSIERNKKSDNNWILNQWNEIDKKTSISDDNHR